MTTTETVQTGWDDATPSADTLTLAALRAMADRACAWAEAAGGRVRRDPGLVMADAGAPCPFLNVAVGSAPPGAATGDAVAGFFPGPLVLLTPHPTPDLRPTGLDLMGHPPFLVRPPGGSAPALPPGVTVTEVGDPAGLADWERIVAEGYPMPLSRAPAALLGSATRFWLAHLDGEPVATAMSHAGHGVVDVEAVATLPAARGRGIGAAVTWAATLAEPHLPAVLVASDAGVGVYRAMGYLPVARWTMWFRATGRAEG